MFKLPVITFTLHSVKKIGDKVNTRSQNYNQNNKTKSKKVQKTIYGSISSWLVDWDQIFCITTICNQSITISKINQEVKTMINQSQFQFNKSHKHNDSTKTNQTEF